MTATDVAIDTPERATTVRAKRWRPYAFHVTIAVYLPVLLLLDARADHRWQQHVLGIATAGLLLFATRYSPKAERRFIWATVAFWTLVEVFGSLVWGIYIYRFDNVPLYVPFGHGLLYLFGLRAVRTPLAARHGRSLMLGAVVVAAIWALGGLTVLPLLTGRIDIAGALLMPIFIYGITRSRMVGFYAAIFVATSALEIIGTALGNWYWVETQPWTGIPQGNPPSVIAGAYCIWDSVASRLARRVPALARGLPEVTRVAANPPRNVARGVSRFAKFRGIL
jgi:hypothetical protein